jgi:hypothetical protein
VSRTPHASAVDVIVAFALSSLAEVTLNLLKPELVLPRWAPTRGGFVGISLLVAVRSLLPPRALPEIYSSAEELSEAIVRITRTYLAASAIAIPIALYFIFAGTLKARAASCLILAGTVYLVYRMCRRNQHLASYPSQLQQKGSVLRAASCWSYGSLLPGVMLSLVGYPVYPYWLPLVVLIAAELNHRALEGLKQPSQTA